MKPSIALRRTHVRSLMLLVVSKYPKAPLPHGWTMPADMSNHVIDLETFTLMLERAKRTYVLGFWSD